MVEFDYIVVGGGTAGCVVASRLSEDGGNSVLLLEAGGRRTNAWLHIPAGYFKTVFDPSLSWNNMTLPEGQLLNRNIPWPRGRVLGGTGAINGMVYIRGQKQDFDYWEQLGNHGWGYRDVLPYFLKSERQAKNNLERSAEFHSDAGPQSISDYPDRHVLCDAFIAACSQSGIAPNFDFNGEAQEGAGYYQITTQRGFRADTAAAFLRPARRRPNLKIVTGAHVHKISIEHSLTRGVCYEYKGAHCFAEARKEVVVCSGAINTPQLLQLSGIGDAKKLPNVGVQPVVNLPGVGKNLQDHLQCQVVYQCKLPLTLNDDLGTLAGRAKVIVRYLTRFEGPIAGGPAPAGAFCRSADDQARADLQIHFLPLSLSAPGVIDKISGYTFNVNQSRPRSRGHIAINCPDSNAPPDIAANYLSDPFDLDTLVDGIRLCRRIGSARPFNRFRLDEMRPGNGLVTDEDIVSYIRAKAASIYHPVGTCKMGTDRDAVVDEKLRVRKVSGLRIADASIMPQIVSGNTNAATVMIAERAADFIKSENAG